MYALFVSTLMEVTQNAAVWVKHRDGKLLTEKRGMHSN